MQPAQHQQDARAPDGGRRSSLGGPVGLGVAEEAVELDGLFGYTEPDGTAEGRTPPPIRRACILLVLRGLHPLADDGGFDARNRWRIIEERTRDQSYKLDRPSRSGGPTGDPELDAILLRYRRAAPLGAA